MNVNLNRVWAAAAAGVLAVVGVAGPQAVAGATTVVSVIAGGAGDQLIFKDGRIIEGKVLEETATQVKFLVIVAGIQGEQTYNKSDILSIERGVIEDAGEGTTTAERGGVDHPTDPADEADAGAPGVYVINIEGFYGRDISQTSLRNIVKDVAKHRPQFVILVVDNAWESFGGEEFDDTVQQFDQLFLTEDLEPILTKEMPDILGYSPEIVVWVKNGMGGAAFLPLNFDTIYFATEGRLGGIGGLENIFGSTGDERVRQKQFSLRLAHARGMANRGGYDGMLIEAMAKTNFIMSYRIESGTAVLIEGLPNSDIGEFLLTDDGAGDNADSDYERARGLGNDNLTLTADVAGILGVSQGVADTLDDLLYELGIDRNYRLIEGREERIRKQWSRSVENAERQLADLWEAFARITVQGERRERMQARAAQMTKLREIIGVLKRYEEVIGVGMFRLPGGLPSIPQLEVLIEQIRQEQMKDRP